MQEYLFLEGHCADFYRLGCGDMCETTFAVKPKDGKVEFTTQMYRALDLMRQYMQMQQYKPASYIPSVHSFDAESGVLKVTIPKSLTSAIPTTIIDCNKITIDQSNAGWITQQAFRLLKLTHEAGIIVPCTVNDFLVCYQNESFILLDWTMAQFYARGEVNAEVAQAQIIDMAKMLKKIVNYGSPCDASLREFIDAASEGKFSSAEEATQALHIF